MFLTRRDLNLKPRVYDWVSCVDVYVVLVCGVSAWLLLHVYVLVDVLDFVIVLFQSVFLNTHYFVSALLFLHVYVLVDVLDFVILLFQSGVFEYILFCVRVIVATRVCFGWCSRPCYRVVSEKGLRIHICLQ